MIRVNIGCGKNPTNGWQNFDNTLSLKLAKFPLVTYFLKMVGFLNKAQIDYIEWNKKIKSFLLMLPDIYHLKITKWM